MLSENPPVFQRKNGVLHAVDRPLFHHALRRQSPRRHGDRAVRLVFIYRVQTPVPGVAPDDIPRALARLRRGGLLRRGRDGRGLCRSRLRSLLRRLPGLRLALRRRGIPPGFGGELDLRRERRERGARQPPVQRIRSGARACRGPRTLRQTASSAPRAKRSACPSSPRLSEPDMFHSFYHSIHILRSLCASQSLLPQEQIKPDPFSPATCASEKIPLGSQTCERSECAAASRIPSNEPLNGVGFD